jgi:hypothetical protein
VLPGKSPGSKGKVLKVGQELGVLTVKTVNEGDSQESEGVRVEVGKGERLRCLREGGMDNRGQGATNKGKVRKGSVLM